MKRTDSFEKYYNRLVSLDCSPGNSWKRVLAHRNYEDLWAVGFDPSNKYLLCITGGEREIWCLDSLSLIHQEERTEEQERICDYHSTIKGFGCCEGQTIQMVSAFGGGLPRETDAWKLYDVTLHWPYQDILLIDLTTSDFPLETALKVYSTNTTLIGYGFSQNGKYFVIAERDQLSIYALSSS